MEFGVVLGLWCGRAGWRVVALWWMFLVCFGFDSCAILILFVAFDVLAG